MEIQLKPQEQSTNSKFNSQIITTKNFINTFGNKAYSLAINAVLKIQKERVPIGADYLQVCEYDNQVFWVIDEVEHITILLPEDY